jgi:hypothetical protein
MRPTSARLTLTTTAVGAALAGVPAALAAQSPTPPPVIEACYVPASGTIYRIKAPNAPNACLSPAHAPFTWNQQGPAGPKGDAGPAATLGYARVGTNPFNVQRGVYTTASKDCPSGKKVVGGGVEVVGSTTSSQVNLDIKESYPSSVSQWRVVLANTASTDFQAIVYAICI